MVELLADLRFFVDRCIPRFEIDIRHCFEDVLKDSRAARLAEPIVELVCHQLLRLTAALRQFARIVHHLAKIFRELFLSFHKFLFALVQIFANIEGGRIVLLPEFLRLLGDAILSVLQFLHPLDDVLHTLCRRIASELLQLVPDFIQGLGSAISGRLRLLKALVLQFIERTVHLLPRFLQALARLTRLFRAQALGSQVLPHLVQAVEILLQIFLQPFQLAADLFLFLLRLSVLEFRDEARDLLVDEILTLREFPDLLKEFVCRLLLLLLLDQVFFLVEILVPRQLKRRNILALIAAPAASLLLSRLSPLHLSEVRLHFQDLPIRSILLHQGFGKRSFRLRHFRAS